MLTTAKLVGPSVRPSLWMKEKRLEERRREKVKAESQEMWRAGNMDALRELDREAKSTIGPYFRKKFF